MAPREPPSKTIRILCFGDSLTAGYSYSGTVFYPYNVKLAQMVEMAFPEYDVESVEDGASGDRVGGRGTFLERMERQCAFVLHTYPARVPERANGSLYSRQGRDGRDLRLDDSARRYQVRSLIRPLSPLISRQPTNAQPPQVTLAGVQDPKSYSNPSRRFTTSRYPTTAKSSPSPSPRPASKAQYESASTPGEMKSTA